MQKIACDNAEFYGLAPTSHGAGALTLYLVKFYGTGRVRSLAAPLGAVTAHDRFGPVTP